MDPAASARDEYFTLRRGGIVDYGWFFGFVVAFGLSGILAFHRLATNFSDAPSKSMFIYIFTIFAAGLVGGVTGTWVANRIADRMDRRDIANGPSVYEPATQDERLAMNTTLREDPRSEFD